MKENARRGRAHISVQSIITTMAVMVLEGGSRLMTKELRWTSFSDQTVPGSCKIQDTYVDKFRNRPLTGSFSFLTANAAKFSAREVPGCVPGAG